MMRAVIFDRDGVLTYFDTVGAAAFYGSMLPLSVEEIGGRWQLWGKQVGFPTTAAAEESFFSSFWTALGQEYGLDPSAIAHLIDRPYTDFVLAYPDARTVLPVLKAAGFKIGVLSNFSLFSLDASLLATGLAAYVHVAHAATLRGHAKPDPLAYHNMAQALNVAPRECLFIDDEQPCVQGAAHAGMTAWWLDRTRATSAPERNILASLENLDELLAGVGGGQIAE